jgi:hypothetical protein
MPTRSWRSAAGGRVDFVCIQLFTRDQAWRAELPIMIGTLAMAAIAASVLAGFSTSCSMATRQITFAGLTAVTVLRVFVCAVSGNSGTIGGRDAT